MTQDVIYRTVLANCQHPAILVVRKEFEETGVITDEIKAVLDIKLTGIGTYYEEVTETTGTTSGPAVSSTLMVRDYTKEGNPAVEPKGDIS